MKGNLSPTERQRIAGLDDADGNLTGDNHVAAGEKSVRVFGFAKKHPDCHGGKRLGRTPRPSIPNTGRFSVDVSPGMRDKFRR